MSKKNKFNWLVSIAAIALIGTGTTGCSILESPFKADAQDGTTTSTASDLPRFSSGEIRLFSARNNPDIDNPDLISGINAFAQGEYEAASELFAAAVENKPQDPEAQIYLNNAQARTSNTDTYILGVAVPVGKRMQASREILRGVANAQTEFNQAGGADGRLLEVVIVNDDNDPEVAVEVAQGVIEQYPNLLGIVGHNDSDISQAVTDIYCPANVAMVSPTSTSTELSGDCFFRTVPSDQESADRLANYIAQSNVTDPVVFYSSNSSYSRSLKEAFEQETTLEEVAASDLSQSAFNASPEVRKYVQRGAKAALLFPSTTGTARAIAVARVNASLDPNQQMQIIGNDALYSDETLKLGKQAVEGMVLTAPWYPNTSYAQQAAERWNTEVSWRTAYSYDAAKALLAAIETADSREGVLQALREVSLPASETAGDELTFDAEGNRVGASVQLVKIVPATPTPDPSESSTPEESPSSATPTTEFKFELLK
ncbi:ABC transporter substrate-binding protein [Coleofasciculus chthonoplastes]|uniref:ABC transporter substrate-binding protein n=1 Tax=Coleofasciculus chthonoplastes TaxID=64178 RepID=UPI003300B74A